MADIPGEALLPISDAEGDKALIAVVSDDTADGEFFKSTIGGLANSQQRVSPHSVNIERIRLVQYTGVDNENRPVASSGANIRENNLDFRTQTIRHSWNDGYYAIEIHFFDKYSATQGADGDWITIILIEEFNEPESYSDHLPDFIESRGDTASIYRSSDTSFAVYNISQNANSFLKEIYGLRLSII